MGNIGRLVVPVAVVLAACGSSTKSSAVTEAPPVAPTTSIPSAPINTSTPSPASPTTLGGTTADAATTGSATADFAFVGDGSLAGASSKPVVSCNYPSLDGGLVLRVLAQPTDPTVLFNMTITASKIFVVVASGSGADYTSRSFQGDGVKAFVASTGVQIDSLLTETTGATVNRGTIGAITSVKGSVGCGDQTVGTSTVTYSGQTLEGAANGAPDPFRVECNTGSQGNYISFVGIVAVGGIKALFFTSISNDSINSYASIAGPPFVQHQYFVKAPGVATLTSTGAHIVGDLVEQAPKSGDGHTVHIEGDLTCGATVQR